MRWSAKTGLSVFELLIALALLSVIAAGLASAMGLGMRVFDRSAEVSDSDQELSLRVQLRNFVAHAAHPTQLVPFPVTFVGERTEVSFVTFERPQGFFLAAALSITIYEQDERLNLEIAELDDDGDVTEQSSYVLAQNALDVSFSYFDAEAGWSETWVEENELPLLFRIEISEGSTPEWPEFTVRLSDH